MTQKPQKSEAEVDASPGPERGPPSAYLWHPWYARLWWVAIPVYWSGMAFSSQIPLLEAFYDLALAGYLNVLFFPPTAIMVLGVGYVREWMGPIEWSRKAQPRDIYGDHESMLGPGGLPFFADELDPRSGPLWIGYGDRNSP